MNWAAVVWLILMVVFLIAEASTVSLVSLWFAFGALGALIASLLGAQLWIQILIFLTVSSVLLALLRPLLRKFIKPKVVTTNVDSVPGSTGYVTEDIDNLSAKGQVKLGSMYWSARSTTGNTIPAGTQVTVDKVEGVKVFVTADN